MDKTQLMTYLALVLGGALAGGTVVPKVSPGIARPDPHTGAQAKELEQRIIAKIALETSKIIHSLELHEHKGHVGSKWTNDGDEI